MRPSRASLAVLLGLALAACSSTDERAARPPGAEPTPPPAPATVAAPAPLVDGVERAGRATPPPPASRGQRIDIDVEDVDLADLMDRIGRQVGRDIQVDPTVQESVTVSLRDIPWREAVDVIARMCRCEVQERPGGVLVLVQYA